MTKNVVLDIRLEFKLIKIALKRLSEENLRHLNP